MKKIIATVIGIFMLNGLTYAFGERAIYPSIMPKIVFASVEGSYNWIGINPFLLNNASPIQTKQNWGGRAAGGLLYYATERFGMGVESGWGYYGGVKMRAPTAGWRAKTSIDGYDVLFDMVYNFDRLDLLGDAGFLVQSQHLSFSSTRQLGMFGVLLREQLLSLYDQTQILPEIKVGGLYHLNENMGISLTYLHVFGSLSQNADTSNGDASDQGNPTLDTLMLGLRLSFEP